MKTQRINVRIAEDEKDELLEVSEALDTPVAIIVRQAVKEKVSQLKTQIQDKSDLALQS